MRCWQIKPRLTYFWFCHHLLKFANCVYTIKNFHFSTVIKQNQGKHLSWKHSLTLWFNKASVQRQSDLNSIQNTYPNKYFHVVHFKTVCLFNFKYSQCVNGNRVPCSISSNSIALFSPVAQLLSSITFSYF